MSDYFTEQIIEMIGRNRSRAASTLPEPREWYLDKNGVIVSRPIESKAASVTPQGINKVKAIHDFIRSNGRF